MVEVGDPRSWAVSRPDLFSPASPSRLVVPVREAPCYISDRTRPPALPASPASLHPLTSRPVAVQRGRGEDELISEPDEPSLWTLIKPCSRVLLSAT